MPGLFFPATSLPNLGSPARERGERDYQGQCAVGAQIDKIDKIR